MGRCAQAAAISLFSDELLRLLPRGMHFSAMGAAEVVVIGGGLAGAAFALQMARHGRRVVVLERTRTPHLKVCGDFLSGETLATLAALGLDAPALGATEITTLRLQVGKRTSTAALPFRAAGLSRLRLDEALLAAAERAGAEVIRGVAVTGLDPEQGGVTVGADGRAWRAQTVALATGKHNLKGWPRDEGSAIAFKMPFAVSAPVQRALAGAVHLSVCDGGYIGACLVEDGTASVCWLANRRLIAEHGADWRAQLDYFARHSDTFAAVLREGEPCAAKPAAIAQIPFGYVRRTAIADNVFPIGDQLAVIPSFTGDGMCLALSSATAAAREVLAGNTASSFQSAFATRLKPQFRWAAAIDAGFKRALPRQLGSLAVTACPALATLLVRLTRLRSDTAPAAVTPHA
jgi:menaquinone-9 beta-reductase